jgi:multiple sugar transport system permease protein
MSTLLPLHAGPDRPARLGARWRPMPSARVIGHAIVLAGALLMFAPFYLMMVFATHTNAEILSVPPPLWFGDALGDNLALLLDRLPFFWRNLGWSFYVAGAVTVLNLLLCSLAGHAFALLDFPGRDRLFGLVLATMLTMAWLGWLNEHKALIVPGACGALGIFMMRQYIGSTVPRELVDAARLDGCGEFGIFWRIVLPLTLPALGTLGLITFIGSWNNFMGPLVVIRDMDLYTVPLALRALQGSGQTPWGALCAGAAVAVLPLLLMFVVASRRLIDGLTAGAVK